MGMTFTIIFYFSRDIQRFLFFKNLAGNTFVVEEDEEDIVKNEIE